MATPPTAQQLQILKIIPRLTGSLSILGSTYIIWDVLRNHGTTHATTGRRTFKVSEGFLLGMSFCDILASVSTPLIGNEAVPPPFGHGNQATCNAQGFFSQFVTATALYTGCLALTYLLSIRYGYREAKLRACLEPLLHLFIGVFILISGTVSIYLELYNPTPFSCTMVSNPPVCGEDSVPCLRGDNVNDWRLVFRTIPEYAVVAFSTIAMLMIYLSVRGLERKSMRWTFRGGSDSLQLANNSNSNLSLPEQAQTQQQEAAPELVQIQQQEAAAELVGALKEEEEEVAPFSSPMDDEEKAIIKREASEITTHKKEVSFRMTTANDEEVAPSTTFHDDNSGGTTDTTTSVKFNGTPSPTTAATTEDSSPPPSRGSLFQQSNRNALERGRQSVSSSRRRRQLLLSRDVGIQGICFILAFLLTWTVPTIMRCLMRFGGYQPGIEWIIALQFFLPLQGFWNLLVYIRPKLWNTAAAASSGGVGEGGSSSLQLLQRASKNSS